MRNPEANEKFGILLDRYLAEVLEVEPTSHLYLLTRKVADAAAEAFPLIKAVPRQPWMPSPTRSKV